jgi:DNA-binding transcriptional LysR family regulator
MIAQTGAHTIMQSWMKRMQKRMSPSVAASSEVPWDLLRSFLAVLETGSLGKAARQLAVSQPSLSRHVKQLEQRLGCELFERRAQRLVATPFARELGNTARPMRSGADDVSRVLASRTEPSNVRISASRMAATHLLPEPLARLLADPTAPSIELMAEDELTNLSEREADLAVRLVRPTQRSLVARRVGTVHFGFYAARAYLRGRPPLSHPADLARHRIIGFDRSPLMVRGARALGIQGDELRFGFRSDDRLVHWAAIRAGVGVGVLPTYLAAREHDLTRLLPTMRLKPVGVWLVARREQLARKPVRRVYDGLRDELLVTLERAPL